MHVFLQGSEGGTQEVRVVNAWHQPKPTDTILCTIAAVSFFFCTAPSVTEVRCAALGRGRPGGARLQGRACRPGSAPTACTAWEWHSSTAEPGRS